MSGCELKQKAGGWWPFSSSRRNNCEHESYDCDRKTCKRIKVIEDKYPNGIDVNNPDDRSTVLALLAGNGISDHTKASQWIYAYNDDVRTQRDYDESLVRGGPEQPAQPVDLSLERQRSDDSDDDDEDGAELERFHSARNEFPSPPVSPASEDRDDLERILSNASNREQEQEQEQAQEQEQLPSPVMPDSAESVATADLQENISGDEARSLTELLDRPADELRESDRPVEQVTPVIPQPIPQDTAPPTMCNSFNSTKLYEFNGLPNISVFVNAFGIPLEHRTINVTISLSIEPGSEDDGWLNSLIGQGYMNIINETILAEQQNNPNVHTNLNGNTITFGVNNVKYRLMSTDRIRNISNPNPGNLNDGSCEVVMVDDTGNPINPVVDIISALQERVRSSIAGWRRPTFNPPDLYIIYREQVPFTRKNDTCDTPCLQVGIKAFDIWGVPVKPAKTFILKSSDDGRGAKVYKKRKRTRRKPPSKRRRTRGRNTKKRKPSKKKPRRKTPTKKKPRRRRPKTKKK